MTKVRQRKKLALSLALAAAACSAPPQVEVSVSEPKVYGDDRALEALDRHRQELARVLPRVDDRPQEVHSVRTEDKTRLQAGLNLTEPTAGLPTPPEAERRTPPSFLGLGPFPELASGPALSPAALIRKHVDQVQHLVGLDLLFQGDTTLWDRRSRTLVLRFEVTFSGHVDLGQSPRFVPVEFWVRTKDPRHDARARVYLLSPSYSSLVAHEARLETVVRERAGEILGTSGGLGLSLGYGSRFQERDALESALERPLQFAVESPTRVRGERGLRFAFAFGPRRRLAERTGLLSLVGSRYEVRYELEPGPRTCQALLVFEDVDPKVPLDLLVSVFSDGRLVGERQVDATRALLRGARPLSTFPVTAPARTAPSATTRLRLVPETGADLVLVSPDDGPSFSKDSTVLLGPVLIGRPHLRLLGRGRLALRVLPAAALLALRACGERSVQAVVLTPDQPDFRFDVDLLSPGKERP